MTPPRDPKTPTLIDRRTFLRMNMRAAGGVLLLGVAACARQVTNSGDTTATTAAAGTDTTAAGVTTATASADAGTLTLAVASEPGGWDQDYLAFDLVGLALMKNFYPYCIDYGTTEVDGAAVQDTQTVLPICAESWESNEDGTEWTLKLKQGISFPSGNELTAADVKWSKDRAFGAQANVAGIYRLIGLTEPDQVEVIDDYTLVFRQSQPSALSSAIQIISLYVFDSELMKENATEDDPWATEWANLNPTNGGVYNVVSQQPGSEIVLEANPDYPIAAYGEGVDPVGTVRIQIVPSASNRRLQLEAGDVDVAFGLSRRDIADLEGVEGIRVISSPSNEFVFVPLSTTTAPFDDKLVRQAMAYAIPYQDIIDNVYQGRARRSTSPVPLDMPGHTNDGYQFDQDLDEARRLLSEAGIGDGFETSLAVAANDPEQEQIAVLIQSGLAEIGVNVTIEPLDPATFQERRAEKTVPMQLASGQMWVNEVEYLMATSLLAGGFLNYAGLDDPDIQAIFDQASTSADDERRMELFAELQMILADMVPWLMIAQPDFTLPLRDTVEGWVQPVDNLFRLQYLSA